MVNLRDLWHRLSNVALFPIILMYHRIADADIDPWELAVSPKHFAEHLDVLEQSRHVLPLTTFVRLLAEGTLPANAVAITFDDGYLCNLTTAAPLLLHYNLPATVFITTGMVGAKHGFWWDELERLIFGSDFSGTLEVTLQDQSFLLDFGAGHENAPSLRHWRGLQPPQTPRQSTYIALWRHFQCLDATDIAESMAQLRQAIGITNGTPSYFPRRALNVEEVRALGDHPLLEIGAHTVSHSLLSTQSPDQQRAEIVESRRSCTALTGREATTFAYPYGDRSAISIELVREAGFSCACSTRRAAVTPDVDLFSLPRLQVCDWSGQQLSRILRSIARG
jgi:peptidoglycan/xylan/chitin deacetylase (PgdA/CDA1 family)